MFHVILILERPRRLAFTLSHELTHFIKEWSPKKFDTFSRFLLEAYGKKGISTSQMLSDKMKQLNTKNMDLAYEEMICDACETMLLDSNAVTKLMELRKTDLDLFEKIKLHVRQILDSIRDTYKKLGLTPTSYEGKAMLQLTDDLDKIHSLFEEAAVDAVKNYQGAEEVNGETEGEVKKQAKKSIDNPYDGKSMYADSDIYNYDFMVSLDPMIVKLCRHLQR